MKIFLFFFLIISLTKVLQAPENPKTKEQKEKWLTCRTDFQVENNYYIDFAKFLNGGIVLISSAIKDSTREFFGLAKAGRYYFESKFKTFETSASREESIVFALQIINSDKECLISDSKNKHAELYDFENNNNSKVLIETFTGKSIYSFSGSAFKISSSEEGKKLYYYLMAFIYNDYNTSYLKLNKYKFNSTDIANNYYILKENKNKCKRKTARYFETKSGLICCFIIGVYGTNNDEYYHTLLIYNQNMENLGTVQMDNTKAKSNDNIFYKAIHLKNEIAVLSFYSDADGKNPPSTLIKKLSINSNNYELKDYLNGFTNIKCDRKGYSHLYNLNDLVKIFRYKILFNEY